VKGHLQYDEYEPFELHNYRNSMAVALSCVGVPFIIMLLIVTLLCTFLCTNKGQFSSKCIFYFMPPVLHSCMIGLATGTILVCNIETGINCNNQTIRVGNEAFVGITCGCIRSADAITSSCINTSMFRSSVISSLWTDYDNSI